MSAFRVSRRVEFGDTDMAGIVHFSNFFRYMESAETAFLRVRGLSVTWADGDERYGFPRVSASCDYLKPVRFADELEISVSLESVGRKSLSYLFEFWLGEDVVARGRMTSVYCRATMGHGIESLEISDELRGRLMQSRSLA